MIILFSGCATQDKITDGFKDDIAEMLDIETPPAKCYYPKLPTYKVPLKKTIPKNMSIEDAFMAQNKVNDKLRFICMKYRKGNITVNKRYQK